ncbi:MAG TPA: dethiobiotin synthase [Gemmatirosa sp.]
MPAHPVDVPLRLAVTGTDTGVGKTLVTCALIAALRARGLDVAAMKPVETGITPEDPATDAARLRAAAGARHDADDVCPVTYREPLAPLVAAERAGRPVELARLDAARARLEAAADALIVEGAGGLLVPFARGTGGAVVDFAALAVRWALDLIVVAGDRLGVLNHALLTVREAERRGLRVRMVVLNAFASSAADVAATTNLATLRTLLPDVPVLPFPHVAPDARDDLDRLAAHAAPLVDVLTPR